MNFSPLQLDALTEVFNHGVGQAAMALSQLANDEVLLSVPAVYIHTKQEVVQKLGEDGARRICAVRQGFSGVVNTEAILMFPVEQSLHLVQMMVGSDAPLEQLSEMEQEALAEVGNIVLNSVVSSMADMLQIPFEGTLPQVELGLVSDVLSSDDEPEGMLLSLQINFEISARQISGYLVFLLDVVSSGELEQSLSAFIEAMT